MSNDRDLEQLVLALAARVSLLESKVRAGQHGLGWDSVRWVSTRECARVFGVTQATVRDWCSKGWIPAARWPNPYNRQRQHRYLIPGFWMMGLPELAGARVDTSYEREQRRKRGAWWARVEAWRAQQRDQRVDLRVPGATVPLRGPGPAGGA